MENDKDKDRYQNENGMGNATEAGNATKNLAAEKLVSDEEWLKKRRRERQLSGIRILGVIFICLGILGAALPFFNSALIERNSKININAITAQDMARNQNNASYFPLEEIEEIGYFNFWSKLGQYDEKNIMGELVIPALQIDLPIFNSSSNENLLVGVGLLYPDRAMGSGNFAVSGHRAQGKDVLLHNLMDAELGQIMYITDKKDIYVYQVVKTTQVDITAVEMLEQDQIDHYGGKPILTVMTCYFGKSHSRWFVIAVLKDVLPYRRETLSQLSYSKK